jgi:hypothetical protein
VGQGDMWGGLKDDLDYWGSLQVTLPKDDEDDDEGRQLLTYGQTDDERYGARDGKILNFFYYREGFDNILTEQYLTDVCNTEKNFQNIPCLRNATWNSLHSFIPHAFDENCTLLTNYDDVKAKYGYAVYQEYFGDSTM